jgi:hypothetical protein
MRKPSQPRDAGGLGREVAARLRVQAERERRIAEIERHFAARGLRAGVLGDGTPECPFVIITDPIQPGDPDGPPCGPSPQPSQPNAGSGAGLHSCVWPTPSSQAEHDASTGL